MTTFLAHLRTSDPQVPIVAAVAAPDVDAAQHLLAHDTGMDLSDTPLTLDAWAAKHGDDDAAFAVALRCDDALPVVFAIPDTDGQMVRYDPAHSGQMTKRHLLGTVTPLDDQFAEMPKACVPPALEKILFSDKGPLFAVVDAAALPDLTAQLEAEGTRYQTLFDGAAADEYGSVAPYLVEFRPDSAVLRNLFTDTDEDIAWHWHAVDAVLFLHCVDGFEKLRAHLRKFTRLQDTNTDKWVYFRFWDRAFRTYLATHPNGPFPRGFLAGIDGAICRLDDNEWAVVSAPSEIPLPHQDFLPVFLAHTRARLRQRFAVRVGDHLAETYDANLSPAALARLYRTARDQGYKTERAMVRRMESAFLLERVGLTDAALRDHLDLSDLATMSDTGRARTILDATFKILNIHV